MLKKINFQYFPFVLNFAIGFITLGLFEFVVADFDISNITTDQYKFNVFIPSFINLLLLLNAAFMYKKIVNNNNQKINEKETVINEISNNNVDVDIDFYLLERNIERKIKAYKKQLRKQISKLEKKAKFKEQMLYLSDDLNAKKNSKYCLKRCELEKQLNLSNEELREKIKYINVDYKPLKKSQIINDYKSKKDDDEYEDINKGIILDNLAPWLFMTTLTAYIYAFTLTPDDSFTILTVIRYLIKIFNGLFSIFKARSYMYGTGLKKILKNLDISLDELKKYLAWKVSKKKEVKSLETDQLQN